MFVFTYQTAEEFAKIYLSKINVTNSKNKHKSQFPFIGREDGNIPDAVNWRTRNIITEVKDQVSQAVCF